ncbi:hypothetical protein NDU88_006769 [Pleurodeles waltl]|uniref:Uncharacterized protein n=1 Tax=Pleurodeles waltl TaxID=8319 RepID=A0AAV7MGQ2_PLEWA|nr:hypothetical protein NDU88_006769 [Pleurodeles waltl]
MPGPRKARRRDPGPPRRASPCGCRREQCLGASWGAPRLGGRALGLVWPRGSGAGRAARGWRRQPGRALGSAAGGGGRPGLGPPLVTMRALDCGPRRKQSAGSAATVELRGRARRNAA